MCRAAFSIASASYKIGNRENTGRRGKNRIIFGKMEQVAHCHSDPTITRSKKTSKRSRIDTKNRKDTGPIFQADNPVYERTTEKATKESTSLHKVGIP